MQLNGLLNLLRESATYRNILNRLQAGEPPDDLRIIRAARPFTLAALAQDWDGPVIFITARVDRAYNVSEQLPVWLPDANVHRFAEPTPLFYDRAPWGTLYCSAISGHSPPCCPRMTSLNRSNTRLSSRRHGLSCSARFR